jgi:fatty acid desaturase
MSDPTTFLPRDQLAIFQRKAAWFGAWMIAFNWLLIVTSFTLVILVPSVLSFIVAWIVIGGRQLGLGILMHETAHRSLLNSRDANDWAGNWLCAAPMFADLEIYRGYHMTHHVKTGTVEDPDLPNYSGYPVKPISFTRKILRDLFGVTGVKALLTLTVLYSYEDPKSLKFGYAYRKQTADATEVERVPLAKRIFYFLRNTRRILLVQLLMFTALWALGHPLLYVLWPVAWMTSYMVITRIRNAAEHGGLDGTMTTDILRNTRTVIARWWERLTVAPNYVNFHFEHHLAPTVPSYNLPKLHAHLKAQGHLADVQVLHGYGEVVKTLVRAK